MEGEREARTKREAEIEQLANVYFAPFCEKGDRMCLQLGMQSSLTEVSNLDGVNDKVIIRH